MASLSPYSITLGATDYPVKYAGLLSYVEPYLTRLETFTFSGGNVGLGVTPSAWISAYRAIDLGATGSVYGRTDNTIESAIVANAYRNSGENWVYRQTNVAGRFGYDSLGSWSWHTAPSGTAGNAISFTQAMTLTAAGQLCIGVTSANGSAKVTAGGLTTTDTSADIFIGRSGATENASIGQAACLQLQNTTNSTACIIQQYSNNLQFFNYTAAAWTERARITSTGDFLVGTTVAAANNGSIGVKGIVGFTGGTAGTYYYTIQSNTTDFYIGNTTLTRYAALVGITTFTAWTFASDRRIKQDIADIDYGLDAVMAIRPRKYKFKDSHQNSIGFIAQELKQVIPDAVTGEELEFNDTDTAQERAKKTMGVSKDLLIPVLVKAIQEQQALITALTARVAALEQA